MRSPRILAATALLSAVAAGTAATAGGVGPLRVDDLRSYATAHGLIAEMRAGGAAEAPVRGATPRARCGPGSQPETGRQGRVPLAEYVNGRADEGYTCNTREVSQHGSSGGYQTHRYTDTTGRVCAYYDSTLLFPKDLHKGATGVTVLDMSDPAEPVQTDTLRTPAMQSPHESLRVHHGRGLLAAGMGSPATQVGFVDVYDVSQDCRKPVLKSSLPVGILGHESGWSPDGNTFWVSTAGSWGIRAIDVSNPSVPSIVWSTDDFSSHGMGLSEDGTRLYTTDIGRGGVGILDVSQVQERVPNPVVTEVSFVTWPEVSIPQNVIPVTIRGRKYLVEFDEFDESPTSYSADSNVGAGRIIDITDERKPRVVSQLRLEVHQPEARRSDQEQDPMATNGLQGYSAHYCSVPRQVDPGIVACSMILSGLRVFDIRDPLRPREVAYFNQPLVDSVNPRERGSYAMSAPAFDPARGQIWYTDGNTGFWNVQVTNNAWPRRGSYPPHY
jgi:hypothetical protein